MTLTVADGRMRVETERSEWTGTGALAPESRRRALRARRLAAVAELKPAYLVCGDDDAKIDAWRARVRRRAEEERGPGGLETFDARQSDPAEVAGALAMLSFDPGTRYLLVDDAGAWKAGELGPLEEALADLPPETVLVLIARGKATKQLRKAVEKAGGETARVRRPQAVGAAQVVRRARARARAPARPGGGEGARGAGRHEPAAALARAREDRRSRCTPR